MSRHQCLRSEQSFKKIVCFYVQRLLNYLEIRGVGWGGNGVGQTVKLECLVMKAHETSFK